VAEGDSIHRLAERLGEALGGSQVRASTPGPRRPAGFAASALDGRLLEAAEARGKHLLLRFSGGLVLHSHLGMRGSWHLYASGERWRLPRRRAWIALLAGERVAVNFDGSSLRIVREGELRRDPRLARLGPDLLSASFDLDDAVARLRRGHGWQLGEALLDQSLVAGIGNVFKSEGCFAAGLSPWASVRELDDRSLAEAVGQTRDLMRSALRTGRRPERVYGRAGRPCPRCGTAIRSQAQGDSARTTYWCPSCQPGPAL
jgi:endonuclease-8